MKKFDEKFPFVRFTGTPAEIGYQHGSLLADRVRHCWEFYRSIIRATEEEIERLAASFAKDIRAFSPPYAEEIEAIAEGAGMPGWQIYALNSRTELIRKLNQKIASAPKECTSLSFEQRSIIGETWDWAENLEHLTVVMEIVPESGPGILQITEPGIIGKIGLNSAGVGVCLNILRCQKPLGGVPVHVLLRAVLESESVDDALLRLESASRKTMSHLLIADSSGKSASVELAGEELGIYRPGLPVLVHTNHYLGLPIDNPKGEFESSFTRFDRATELSKEVSRFSVDEMKKILTDEKNGPCAICHDYNPDEVNSTEGTVCAVVLDLPERVMHVTRGSPRSTPFTAYQLS